jgi:2-amino-4-hydroxy-6-hydroxymethyldihydropteridine diphosphokinase
VTAVLSLGSNLGDRTSYLSAGVEVLSLAVAIIDVSPVFETAPVGRTDQPPFVNIVVRVGCDDVEAALHAAHVAEDSQGRLRATRWGPRTLDVDVVDVDGRVCNDPRLTLPHPRAHERAFVLLPWLALDPEAALAGYGAVRTLAAGLDTEQVARLDAPLRWNR